MAIASGSPLAARKSRLAALLARASPAATCMHLSTHVEELNQAALGALCACGFEGIFAKRVEESYRSGRGRSWLKIKCRHDAEYVVGGYSPSTRGLPFASVLLGRYDASGLRDSGRAGSRLDVDTRHAWLARFKPLRRVTSPFVDALPASIAAGAVWLDPTRVAKVGSAGLTGQGLGHRGSLQRLHEDLPAVSVGGENDMLDTITIADVQVTHAARPVYTQPRLTKARGARLHRARGAKHAASRRGASAQRAAMPRRSGEAMLLPALSSRGGRRVCSSPSRR